MDHRSWRQRPRVELLVCYLCTLVQRTRAGKSEGRDYPGRLAFESLRCSPTRRQRAGGERQHEYWGGGGVERGPSKTS